VTAYIALLRAVNVGGTGKLSMAELKDICVGQGFVRVGTYIASGNVIFDCELTAPVVQGKLERRLAGHTGPQLTYAFFLNEKPPSGSLDDIRGRDAEELHLGEREIYVHYPDGMWQSKLKIPAAKLGTARNLNTVAKLVEISSRR
jgi:uncharacterized protein (DUF1697 family)